jgi:histidinol-phosphate aminotransferase
MNRRDLFKSGLAGIAVLPFLQAANCFAETTSNKIIKLTSNENPYGFSPKAKQVLVDSLNDGNRYASPDFVAEFEREIARREGLKPENVVLGTGSGEILCMAAIGFGQKEIVAPDPTFPSLMRYAENFGAKIKNVPLNEKFEHDFSAMARNISENTSLVYVCNPNNPTASMSPINDLRAFCRETAKKVTVFADEAYLEYTDDFPRNSMIDLVQKGENVIVSRTFSKIYGMAGLRIGYGLARTDIAQKLRRLRMTWFNNPSIQAASVAYNDLDFLRESKRKNEEVRTKLQKEFDKMNLKYAPSDANFLWVNVGAGMNDLGDKMRNHNILLSNPRNQWARITIGTNEEMTAFVKAFKEIRG